MSNFDIVTSQNVAVEYKLAGLGNRLLAAGVDFVLFLIWTTGTSLFIAAAGGTTGPFVLLLYLPVIFYSLLMEIFFNGQSLGKMMLDIRVMKTDGSTPTLTAYFLRWMFRLIDIGISLGSVAVTTIAFTDRAQRLGDLAAGTTVISTKPATRLQELIPAMPDEDYQPKFHEVITLTDRDIRLIKKVLFRYRNSHDLHLLKKMALHIRNLLAVETDLTDAQFLKTVLLDYEYFALQDKSIV